VLFMQHKSRLCTELEHIDKVPTTHRFHWPSHIYSLLFLNPSFAYMVAPSTGRSCSCRVSRFCSPRSGPSSCSLFQGCTLWRPSARDTSTQPSSFHDHPIYCFRSTYLVSVNSAPVVLRHGYRLAVREARRRSLRAPVWHMRLSKERLGSHQRKHTTLASDTFSSGRC